MNSFHLDNDNVRLRFINYEQRSDDEEYAEIMSILKSAGCLIGRVSMAPDCDYINCRIKQYSFTVIHTIDGDGSFIYCDNQLGMKELEKIFPLIKK